MVEWRCKGCGKERADADAGIPCPDCGEVGRVGEMEIHETVHAHTSFEAGVVRGAQSWAYYYAILAIVVGIEVSILFALNIPIWARIISCIAVVGITGAIFLYSGWLQNLLSRFRSSYEDKAR